MRLTDHELTILRLLGAGGMIEEERLVSLLEQRALFQEGEPRSALASLATAGLVESSSGLCWHSDDGKAALRRHIQQAFKDLLWVLEQEVWPAFKDLDSELKSTCSMWQVKQGGTPNLHDDPDYDFYVLEKLNETHERLFQLLRRQGALEQELSSLLTDMSAAMERINDGEFEFVVGMGVNSYHNLWRELHEHFLSALGLERTE